MGSDFHLKTFLFLCWFDIFSWVQLIIIVIVINGNKLTARIFGRYCSLRICNWSKGCSCYLCFLPALIVSWSILPSKKSLKLSVLYLERWPSPLFFKGAEPLMLPFGWVCHPLLFTFTHWSWIHYNLFCGGAILMVFGST